MTLATNLAIAGTLTIAYFSYKLYKLYHYPSYAKGIPYVPFSVFIKQIMEQTPYDVFYNEQLKDKFAISPVVAVPQFLGWDLQLASTQYAKYVTSNYDTFHHMSYAKLGLLDSLGGIFNGDSVVIVDGQKWRNQRPVVNAAFSKLKPTTAAGIAAQDLLAKLEENIGRPINAAPFAKRAMFRSLLIAVFDVPDLLINDFDQEICRMIDTILVKSGNPFFLMFSRLDRPWFPTRAKYFKLAYDLEDIIDNVVKQKKKRLQELNALNDEEYAQQNKGIGRDLITLMLIASQDPENAAMTDDELMGNLKAFFLAGYETTATSFTMLIHVLARYPEIQKKCRQEIFDVMGIKAGDQVVPTPEHQKEMIYLNAVIRETQRLYPSTAQLVNRQMSADVTLPNGLEVPKGAYTTYNVWSQGRNPETWSNPEEFRPERHLGENREGRNLGEFMTFSAGKRICPGMNLALVEMRVMIVMMLSKLSWRYPDPEKDKNVKFWFFWLLRPLTNDFIFEHLE